MQSASGNRRPKSLMTSARAYNGPCLFFLPVDLFFYLFKDFSDCSATGLNKGFIFRHAVSRSGPQSQVEGLYPPPPPPPPPPPHSLHNCGTLLRFRGLVPVRKAITSFICRAISQVDSTAILSHVMHCGLKLL